MVGVPGAAQVVLAVEDHEIVVAEAFELDGRTDSAETGADDHDVELLRSHADTIPLVPDGQETRQALRAGTKVASPNSNLFSVGCDVVRLDLAEAAEQIGLSKPPRLLIGAFLPA